MAPADALLDELVRVSADLDRLIADRQAGGQPSHTRHEAHIDQVEKLAARLRAVVRGPGRQVNPPRFLRASGRKAGW